MGGFREKSSWFHEKRQKKAPDRGTAGGDGDTRVGVGVGSIFTYTQVKLFIYSNLHIKGVGRWGKKRG